MEEKEVLIKEPSNSKLPVFMMIIGILLIAFGLVLDWAGTFDKPEPVNNEEQKVEEPVNEYDRYLGNYINDKQEKIVVKQFDGSKLIIDFKISMNEEVREFNDVEFKIYNLEGKTVNELDQDTEVSIKFEGDKITLTYGSISSIYEKEVVEPKTGDEMTQQVMDYESVDEMFETPDTDIYKVESDENNTFTFPDEEVKVETEE